MDKTAVPENTKKATKFDNKVSRDMFPLLFSNKCNQDVFKMFSSQMTRGKQVEVP